jgi:hypothetical protein
MKRHPALQALSRDHDQTLVVAQRLCRAGDHDAGEALASFLKFWRNEGELHFRLEEEVLLPSFATAGGAETPAVARVLIEHAEIRCAPSCCKHDRHPRLLKELDELLADQVRLEENELFPAIEESLDDGQLYRLAADVAAAEREGGRAG